MSQSEPPSRLAFDDVVIDFAGRRLWRGGVEQPLEPKAFGVLVLLAGLPGRVFTRDEILDAVWGHRHVTPGVLNRAVTLLRHALGEDAQGARYLQTVHGVGYRFDLPMDAAPTSAQPAAADTASPRPDTVTETIVPPAVRSAARAWPSAALGLAALLILLTVAAWRLWPQASPVSPASSPAVASVPVAAAIASPTLVVLPLRALGGGQGETMLAEGLSEELTTRLSRIGGLGVICATSAAIAQSRQFDSVQLAEQLKTTHALEGSLRETGDRMRVNLRLSELPGGRVIWTEIYDRPIAGFAGLQNDVATEVARTLSLRDAVGVGVPRDVDPAALKRFLDVRRRISNGSAPDWEAQLQALAADYPDYAQPHGLLGSMLAQHAPRRDEAEREATRAMQLDPGEAHAYIALAFVAVRDGDWERAEQMYAETLRLAPADPYYRAAHGIQLGSLGYLEDGLREADIGAAYGPLGGIYVVNMRARLLGALGRHDQAKQAIDVALVELPTPTAAYALHYTRFLNAFWQHDAAAARAAAADLPESIWKASSATVAAVLDDPGQWPQARAAMDESERIARGQGDADAMSHLRLLDPQAEPATLLDLTRRLQRDVNAFSKLTIWMPERHALRQTPEFQDFLSGSGILAYWRQHGFPPQCRAHGDGAICD